MSVVEDKGAVRSTCSIEAEELVIAYRDTKALTLPKLSMKGNIIAIIGHNGAGKSTLIKSILGLIKPQAGLLECQCNESETSFALLPEKHMAFCPESGSVFSDIRVEAYIKLWCRIKAGRANYYKRGGAKYIELLKLRPLLGKMGRELSKGQRRRVQTAVGFLSRPKLFLIDEPFCGLDVQKANELTEVLFEAAKEMSFVLASHRMDVVERLADFALVLKEGSAEASGSVREVSQALCKKSVRISNLSNQDAILPVLKERYGDCLISRVGDQIAMSGSDFTLPELKAFVGHFDANGATVQSVRPCLVDALNYHLKQIAEKRLETQ